MPGEVFAHFSADETRNGINAWVSTAVFRCINYINVDEVGIACILYNVPFAGF